MENVDMVLAGATGKLGGHIASEVQQRGGTVRALVRPNSSLDKIEALRKQGVTVVEVNFRDATALSKACAGGACVVSSLSGLRDVIVDTQTLLLNATIASGVPRFIPSDFAIDFTKVPPGTNRNLDLRREFYERLEKAPIAVTSVLNGMFMDLLLGKAPVILTKFKRVLYWENEDQLMDFTTLEDTATFTAAAALDSSTPRFLRIAGDQMSARGLAKVATEVTGEDFHLFRAGGLGTFGTLIKGMQLLMPGKNDVFPPWQGMQYLRNMFAGEGHLKPLDNNRYPGVRWTTVRAMLAEQESVRSVSPDPA